MSSDKVIAEMEVMKAELMARLDACEASIMATTNSFAATTSAQTVRTPACHVGDAGSIPAAPAKKE